MVRQPYRNAEVSYQNLFDDLYQAIAHNAEPIIKLEDVIFVLKVIESVFESAKLGQKIYL